MNKRELKEKILFLIELYITSDEVSNETKKELARIIADLMNKNNDR